MGSVTESSISRGGFAGCCTEIPRPAPSRARAVHWCAGVAGVSVRDDTLDARILADCVIRSHERFRPDDWLSADTWVPAHAMRSGDPVVLLVGHSRCT